MSWFSKNLKKIAKKAKNLPGTVGMVAGAVDALTSGKNKSKKEKKRRRKKTTMS